MIMIQNLNTIVNAIPNTSDLVLKTDNWVSGNKTKQIEAAKTLNYQKTLNYSSVLCSF